MDKKDYERREEQLRQLRPMTRAFRKVTADFFPNPDPATSLMYAVTELGEALSAWLEEQRPGDVRANPNKDLAHELCDALMMLHGAMAPDASAIRVQVCDPGTGLSHALSVAAMYLPLPNRESGVALVAEGAAAYINGYLYDLCGEQTAEIYRARLLYRIHMAADRAGFHADQISEVIRQWHTALATELASI